LKIFKIVNASLAALLCRNLGLHGFHSHLKFILNLLQLHLLVLDNFHAFGAVFLQVLTLAITVLGRLSGVFFDEVASSRFDQHVFAVVHASRNVKT
jgi:hypothetical protein